MHRIKPHMPLHKSLTVAKSKIHGLGLFATNDINPNTDLGISHILNKNYKDGLIRTPLGGFLNHSDTPNCKYNIVGNDLRLVTTQKIDKGQELTSSYRGWYSDDILDLFN